jgi:hypothetical protein
MLFDFPHPLSLPPRPDILQRVKDQCAQAAGEGPRAGIHHGLDALGLLLEKGMLVDRGHFRKVLSHLINLKNY